MRKAVVISLAFHLSLTILVFQWVSFREVTYVPRQVYNVTLVNAALADSRPVVAPAPPKAAPAPEEKEPEPKKEEEMAAPPEKPKPPRDKKAEAKAVPTTRIQKSDSLAGAASDSATQAPTAGTGGVSFDNGDFPFTHYVNRMRQKIAAAWQVPSAGSDGLERSAVIYFRVHRDGSVSHVAVEKTSNVSLFDQSCQRAVLQAAPMPPLPREYADDYLGVHFSFVYLPVQ